MPRDRQRVLDAGVAVDAPSSCCAGRASRPRAPPSCSSSRAACDDLLALLAARLVVALDAERADRLQAPQVGERVVERVDLGLEVALGAVEDRAGREDARRDDRPARAAAPRRRTPSFVSLDGSWIVVTPKARLASVDPVALRHDAVRRRCAPCAWASIEPGHDGLARRVDDLGAGAERPPSPARGRPRRCGCRSTTTTPSSITSSPRVVTGAA